VAKRIFYFIFNHLEKSIATGRTDMWEQEKLCLADDEVNIYISGRIDQNE